MLNRYVFWRAQTISAQGGRYMAYDDVKEFNGRKYMGMPVGGRHVWSYPKNQGLQKIQNITGTSRPIKRSESWTRTRTRHSWRAWNTSSPTKDRTGANGAVSTRTIYLIGIGWSWSLKICSESSDTKQWLSIRMLQNCICGDCEGFYITKKCHWARKNGPDAK